MARWSAHGKAIQRIVDRVVYIKVIGAFNREGAEANARHIKLKVGANFDDGQPWANFHDLTHFELGTPDLKDVAESHYVWSIEHGMTHEAILAPTMMAREMMQMLLEPYTEKVQFEYFNVMDDALDWLVLQKRLLPQNKHVLSDLGYESCSIVDIKPSDKSLRS
jgi:hypothetical protein